MSNMLEQAIADAAALREQAIKNAEQSVLTSTQSKSKKLLIRCLRWKMMLPLAQTK